MAFKKLKSIFSRAGNSAKERIEIYETNVKGLRRLISDDIDLDLNFKKKRLVDRYRNSTKKMALNNWTQAVIDFSRGTGMRMPHLDMIELEKLYGLQIDGALFEICTNKGTTLYMIDDHEIEIKAYREKQEAKKRIEKIEKELKDVKEIGKVHFKDRSSVIKLNKIKDKITKKFSENKSRIYNGLKTYSWIVANLIPRMTMMTAPSAPAAIVGFLPLTSVYYMERARSDRVLKIRAVGGVFLAHQEGGNDTLIIKGLFTGISRQAWLLILQILQKYGENAPINARFGQMKSLTGGFEDTFSISKIKSFVDKSEDIGGLEQEIYSFEYHKTFTIVTGTDILMNMYLQTLQFENKVENGHHVIKYTCIFQKYIKPSYFFMTKKGEEKKPLTYKQVSGETGWYKAKEELADGIWKVWKTAIEAGDIIGRSTNPFTTYIDPVVSPLIDLIRGFQTEMIIG